MGKKYFLAVLTTLLTAIIIGTGTVGLYAQMGRITLTGVQLMVLNDNVRFYNGQSRKTDAMTNAIAQDFQAREAIYNSDDNVIRIYANLPGIVKFLVWILILPLYIFILLIDIVILELIGKEIWGRLSPRRKRSR